MKRYAKVALCMLAMILVLLSSANAQQAGLINGSFEEGDGMDGWITTAWEMGEVFTSFEIVDEGEDGGYCAFIRNFEENDARFEQTFAVEGGSLYRFSARVKVEDVPFGIDTGANLSIVDTFAASNFISDTAGEWKTVEFYGRTEKKQTSITLSLRLGYYGGLCTGSAWFDNVMVEKVDQVPGGVRAQSLKTNPPVQQTNEDIQAPDRAGLNAIVMSVLFAVLALALMNRINAWVKEGKLSKHTIWLVGVLLLGLVVRLVIAYKVPGYGVDMNCFGAWGEHMLGVGPSYFYFTDMFCDYPPGYMYILGGLAWISELVGVNYLDNTHQLILKMPSILCDLATCYVIYRTAKKLDKPHWGLVFAALYALCPAVIADSAAWGQVDSILTLLMALSLLAMVERRMMPASIFFCIGVLVKPQALMFGPILLLAFIGEIIEDGKKGWKELGICFAACALLFIVAVLPVNGLRNPLWLVELYAGTLGSYGYASVNAMNLFAMLGGNWQDQTNVPFLFSWQTWGTIMMVLSIGYAYWLYLRKRDRRALLMCATLILAGIFTFGVRMHERYLFPALALFLLAALYYKDRRFVYVFLAFAATQTINILVVLAHEHVLQTDLILTMLCGAINIGATIYLGYLGYRLTAYDAKETELDKAVKIRRQVVSMQLPSLNSPGNRDLRFTRLDVILLLVVTLAYSVLAFINLGDTDAPKTSFRSSKGGEAVVFDLGEARDVKRFYYYGEIPSGTMTLAFSQDGINFVSSAIVEYKDNIMFKWNVQDLQEEQVRYARVTFDNPNMVFFELGFSDWDGVAYPASVLSHEGGRQEGDVIQNPALLVDEQSFVPTRPTYMNSMYFDEIYHARTAYEHLNDMVWYENTHPPLGKVFMSWCIDALGMNPFAWRLAGTVAGIAMLPGMYLLAKLLFKRTELAFAATLLLAADNMHFAQTRIATIDSFPVLFIIWGFFFMFLYASMSFYHEKFWKTLPPLFAAGICMGLGCASKWIGIYSGVGLGVVFFYVMGKRYLEYRRVIKGEHVDSAVEERVRKFPRYAAATIGCCLIFFVAIPVLIYVGSYYQYLGVPGSGNDLEGVWNYQTHMLNYHSGVFDDHPYASTWYQWPVIWKPMAFFFDYRMAEGWSSSISTFGNPAVWWAGLVAMVWTIFRWVRGDSRKDPRIFLVIIGFAAQYLPWVLVPRTTYIYHYFASVPFIILAITFFLEQQLALGKVGRNRIIVYLCVVVALFFLFYPVSSGMEVPITLAKATDWFPSWHLYWGG